MRTLRLSLTGTVTLMLLAGLSGVVVAQDEEALASDRPHPISGTPKYAGAYAGGAGTMQDGRLLQRGHGSRDTIEMVDARLSGTLWHVWNRDHLSFGEVLTGTVELANDDGSWVGTMRGYVTPSPRTHYWDIELTGSGVYEGLSALLHAEGYMTHEVEGFIFPGVLPAYPDPVEVPAD